jgi:hypothetical protein
MEMTVANVTLEQVMAEVKALAVKVDALTAQVEQWSKGKVVGVKPPARVLPCYKCKKPLKECVCVVCKECRGRGGVHGTKCSHYTK